MDLPQLHRLPAHVIHHAPGCSDNHLHAVFQGADLSSYLLPPVNRQNLDSMHIFCQAVDFIRNLDSQLSCWAQDNRLRLFKLRIHLLQKRNPERRRLSRPGLGLADNIQSLKLQRNGPRLNRRSGLKPHIGYSTHDLCV